MKKTYEKPTLRKHGKLTARTAQIVVSGVTIIQ
ncbi:MULTISPECIES: putative RiPP precursor [unclassified Mesorhizobium]|nr:MULTISPECIES: putative RiPP precursor [unclassified Mesorhizobium]